MITPAPDGLDPAIIRQIAELTLAEDLAGGVDVTTEATVPVGAVCTADLVARRPGVVAGLPLAVAVFELAGVAADQVRQLVPDGTPVAPGQVVLTVTGSTRAILIAERSALNLICRLSGIATLTDRWVQQLAGTGTRLRDTRKTTPGLRAAEKYAVRCGGGRNHRMSLADQALIKDNHVLATGGVAAAIQAVRSRFPDISCEVECDTVEQVGEALAAGAAALLLDNMTLDQLRAGVELARARGATTEASGNLSLERAREVAATGVDFLAVGALTHSAPALDLGLDLRG